MRKKPPEEHENHERWLVSYADFITLLFAFFVVMYATSTNNEDKQKKFEDSVREKLHLGVSAAPSAQNINEAIEKELGQGLENFPKRAGPTEMQDYLQRSIGKEMSEEDQKKFITQIHHDFVGARITLAASSFFPLGSVKLKKSALGALDKVAEILKRTDKKVVIEGHTDDQPIQMGNIASNWELASLRATTVVRYLIRYHGIEASRLAAISYADQKPLVNNDNEENRAKNRRIEVLIVAEP